MYVVLLNGEIKKEYRIEKLKQYASIGFFCTNNYIDALAYSRALLLRGSTNKTVKNYFISSDIVIV